MSKVVSMELDEYLDDAERMGVCVFATSRREWQCLSARAKSYELHQPHPRLFVRSDYWNALDEKNRYLHVVRSLGVLHPNWTFSFETAAVAHGIADSRRLLEKVHVTTPASTQQRLPHGSIVRHAAARLEREEVDRVHVTPLAMTVVDCCRTLGFAQGLAIADAALRSGRVDMDGLVREVRDQHGRRGIREAARTIALADGRSENGGESIARAAMIELGFVIPDLQVNLEDPLDRAHVIRVDYLWTLPGGGRVAGELDGFQKYVDPGMTAGRSVAAVLVSERRRESHINALHIPVVRFTFKELSDGRRFARKLEAFGVPRQTLT
jgi:hypothetical protein